MGEKSEASRRIRILRDEVSRKIAAGEVIDRPLSIVRELLDNSLDAGSSSIEAYLEGGGITRVRVADDGEGMGREDLELCWQPHATSKIETEDDLLTVRSLGFRGEALSSIAVAARLEIVSARGEGEAGRLVVRGGRGAAVEPWRGRKGTVVDVSELFFDFPARKRFLKSSSAESALCRSVLVDRAVSRPDVAFRLFTDGELRLFLPPASRAERIGQCYASLGLDARVLGTGSATGAGFTVSVLAADPGVRRRDRKLLQAFVNGRRVPEYSLLQAAEYGFAGFVPGGWFPAAFVFVDIDPALVDFNIHPAKKEVRFRSLPEVHSAVVRAVRERLGTGPGGARAPSTAAPEREGAQAFPILPGGAPRPQPAAGGPPPHGFPSRPAGAPDGRGGADAFSQGVLPRFLGQAFGVFLLFELGDRLILLDQHAAHEKTIFDALFSSAPPQAQELLFPVSFDTSREEAERLDSRAEDLQEMGIAVRRAGRGTWEVTALSPAFSALPEDALVGILRSSAAAGEGWARGLAAGAACRMAMKEGDPVDPVTAVELMRRALDMEVPRCPHGRPLWHEIGRKELYRRVDRPAD
jgi:DNA mismatch repair protein MutL